MVAGGNRSASFRLCCYILTFNVFVFACSVREDEKMERIWDSVVKFIDINVRNNSQGVMIKI